MRKLLNTPNDFALTLARWALGGMIIVHGSQKLLGLFGGPGYSGTVQFMGSMGIPVWLATLAVMAEFFGGLGLIFGGLTRIAALGVLSVMATAVYQVHWANGFFMNWAGNQKGEGFEFHILAIGLALAVMIRGAGAFSIDHWVTGLIDRSRAAKAKPQQAVIQDPRPVSAR